MRGGALVAAALVTALGLASAATGTGPVPAHTSAASLSFVSASEAFVLGTAPCAHRPCTVVLHTTDRGASWVGIPAPGEAVSRFDGDGLWGIRFADAHRGFAYGDGLWTTGNGGESWSRVDPPARLVLSLATVGDRDVVAIASKCGDNLGCPERSNLFVRPLSGGAWKTVVGAKPVGNTEGIAVHGNDVWAFIGAEMLVSTDAGARFTIHPTPCVGPVSGQAPTSIATTGRTTYLLCTGEGFTGHTFKYVYRTTGTTSPWKLVGRPPAAGDGGELAAASGRTLVIATASAASWLYRSTDSGRHWAIPLQYGDGGEGWTDLQFTTPTDGAVIHGPAQQDGGSSNFPGQFVLTGDGGRSWHAARF